MTIWRNLAVLAGGVCRSGIAAAPLSASSPEDAADLILRQGLFHTVASTTPVRGSLAVQQ